jgi:hypothetical protein
MKVRCVMCTCIRDFLIVQPTNVCVHLDVYKMVISETADLSFVIATFIKPE